MSCCGSKRQEAARNAYIGSGLALAPAAVRGRGTGVLFVFDGAGALVVTGSVSGRRYRFGERGARLSVDARDAPALDALPRLRRVAV
jgi:hypothetical protein